jgi:predicted ATP-binding protein involved in virulence
MIDLIDFKLAGSHEKRVNIDLEGKNLIITGQNGCGKTRLLGQLFRYLQDYFQRKTKTKAELQERLAFEEKSLKTPGITSNSYKYTANKIHSLKEQLERISSEHMMISNSNALFELANKRRFVLRFFDANRLASNIAANGQADSISNVKQAEESLTYEQDSSTLFEKYLVSYFNLGSYVIARENDSAKEQQITAWFNKVQNDLRSLFEDEELTLQYNALEQAFYIHQQGKEPYRFNQLSSGYSSILSIYADLLMKVELRDISADEITGFVLIDEIDAHLHVSIQRKIFSFFDKAFPKIQFIVTTHSPFVVQSVNNAIIYDLSRLEPLEDLSMYSYESILKGLLGVESTSDILNQQLDEIAQLVRQAYLDKSRLVPLIQAIEPFETKLDPRSLAFYLLGKNALLDANEGEE